MSTGQRRSRRARFDEFHQVITPSPPPLDASRLLRQIARCQCPHVSRTLARVSSLSSRNIFSPLFTALSGCNGNVRTFFECRTYVISVLGILTFCLIFSLCGHISWNYGFYITISYTIRTHLLYDGTEAQSWRDLSEGRDWGNSQNGNDVFCTFGALQRFQGIMGMCEFF